MNGSVVASPGRCWICSLVSGNWCSMPWFGKRTLVFETDKVLVDRRSREAPRQRVHQYCSSIKHVRWPRFDNNKADACRKQV